MISPREGSIHDRPLEWNPRAQVPGRRESGARCAKRPARPTPLASSCLLPRDSGPRFAGGPVRPPNAPESHEDGASGLESPSQGLPRRGFGDSSPRAPVSTAGSDLPIDRRLITGESMMTSKERRKGRKCPVDSSCLSSIRIASGGERQVRTELVRTTPPAGILRSRSEVEVVVVVVFLVEFHVVDRTPARARATRPGGRGTTASRTRRPVVVVVAR